MEIKICKIHKEWNRDLEKKSEFLQSWLWGDLAQKVGQDVWRFQIFDKGKLKNQFQGTMARLSFVNYFYLPRVSFNSSSELGAVLNFLKDQNCDFVRVESAQEIKKIKFNYKKIKNRQPQYTWILDLQKSEEELLKQMHSKHKYNINLAKKKGVVIRKDNNPEIFWNLVSETSERHKIKSHDKDYYKEMLDLPFVYQVVAYVEGKPAAANIMVDWEDTLIYLHGASSYEYRNFMSPYLLQWQSMIDAKKDGKKFYDFWGIAEVFVKKDDKISKNDHCFHEWCWHKEDKLAGVTRFKVGFGGALKKYPNAQDFVFKGFKYFVYKTALKMFGIWKKFGRS